jgi:hypothetical protein
LGGVPGWVVGAELDEESDHEGGEEDKTSERTEFGDELSEGVELDTRGKRERKSPSETRKVFDQSM